MGHNGSKQTSMSLPSSPSSGNNDISSDSDSDQNQEKVTPKLEKKRSSKKKMSLFRSQSAGAKRRLDHLLYLGQESPEPNFDLSNCEMSEVPPNVYSLCKVLNKEALLLNDNWILGLDHSKVGDLKMLRVLDLHNNKVKLLPFELGGSSKLQVLNLENNRLGRLPDSLTKLRHLQTLNVKGNKFKIFPMSICRMKSLRLLDISDNLITSLPKELCQVVTLETIILDAEKMTYPPADVCCQGTEAIMQFLCDESRVEYLAPSNFLLRVLDSPDDSSPSGVNDSLRQTAAEEKILLKTLEDQRTQTEKKRLEKIELERNLAENQREQAYLASLAQNRKQSFIDMVAEDQNKIERELEELSMKKDEERSRLLTDLKMIEEGTNNLIQKMLEMNEKARKNEELLDQLENERIEKEELFVVRWEEVQNLRKKEVLDAMKYILTETEGFEKLRQDYTTNKEFTMQKALEDEAMLASGQVESILYHREVGNMVMLDILKEQGQLQREAFEALQLQKDTKHQRISTQIALIQEELMNLTAVEIEKRSLRTEEEINVVAEKRIALIELLSQLMCEQEKRQILLKRRLKEMEQQRQDGQTDYWLVQYQRLMDKKPQALIDQERQLEIAVVTILEDSSADDYIPLFARHRITIETLLQLSEDDLKQMGVHEMGLRKSILRNLDHYREKKGQQYPKPKEENKGAWDSYLESKVQDNEGESEATLPSAPPVEPCTTRQSSILARGINTECVVCLDKSTDVIFLNCGHVCTCIDCSVKVQECPLCREPIAQRVKLMISSS
ncbi:E3 ubiquitin-protein ligase LRSAM1-like [Mizuhopecten yessoensis]|uniref:E3 ubiquitin-protein ligase LRSAM1 n=1 Tax=Mizuhopecten yessoensis TaxID=6573 RepID=A0A210QV31_MIZYE|nr:E3 ubiquitin-protein ligase LRSAM1-like [Mizuhopecten yessoensis]OWF52585.1 E3 ubiquitin-protein ligase LRSAM1 [Mizuhopecten yessoensis]